MDVPTPRGFRVHTGNCGIKDGQDDFAVIASDVPASVSAVFTRSRFAGPSVTLSRTGRTDGRARAIVALSGNANVATGDDGLAAAREVRGAVASVLSATDEQVIIASTGLIGRQYPMDDVRVHLRELTTPFPGTNFAAAARAIMTTDTHPKVHAARCGPSTVIGMAKGVGMMEPNMATLLAFFCTDAEIDPTALEEIFRRVVGRTFNALSIDTDTSTSDTAVVLANGLAGPVDLVEFERELLDVALRLVKAIAKDGEGSTKLIEVRVTGARDDDQAKRVGKTVVNSPLVKTAVHGADPNWGRVAMAIGKCEDDTDIVPERVTISFGPQLVYPILPGPDGLAEVTAHLKRDDVLVDVDLGIADGDFTVYGCDLSEGYVRLNADYST
jgi:glutamate N-acetyltransferase/amino-acid N-acetyltransferase